MKKRNITAYLGLVFLFIALILELIEWPNSIIFTAIAAFLFSFVNVPISYVRLIKKSKNGTRKFVRIFFMLLWISLPFVIFASMQMESEEFTMVLISEIILIVLYMIFFEHIEIVFSKTFGFDFKYILICLGLFFIVLPVDFQMPDRFYNAPISKSTYKKKEGPLVYIDEGHYNFHTKKSGFAGFSKLLEKDGYNVESYKTSFTKEGLEKCKILIIANAISERNVEDWSNPVLSAFTMQEIEIIRRWVWQGGRLMLIADHMPYGGASKELADAFGFEFQNSFLLNDEMKHEMFSRSNSTLYENTLTNGRNEIEKIDSIYSFTGQGFKIPSDAIPILVCDSSFYQYYPDTAWVFDGLKKENALGYVQGAYKVYGEGKVVVFGEAAMLTTQYGMSLSYFKVGMNAPYAKSNYKLVLNSIHWLDDILE